MLVRVELSEYEVDFLLKLLDGYRPGSGLDLESKNLVMGLLRKARASQVSTVSESKVTQPDTDTKS